MPPGADTTTPPTSNDGYRCDETHQAIDSGNGRIALESSCISSMPRTLPAVTEEKTSPIPRVSFNQSKAQRIVKEGPS